MPNRILKESICTSAEIDALTAFQETVFYRLIVVCDDYGRMDARPKLLASRLFPLKDVRVNQIEDALQALSSVRLITLYTVDGKPFLQMMTWDRHQQIRAKKSKYPSPDDRTPENESVCNQLISDDSKCPRNPIRIQSESNPNPNTNVRTHDAEIRERFEQFWTAYPRHTAKQNAWKAFQKLKPDEALLGQMLKALEQQKQSDQWTRDGGSFIPHPATWLNQERWTDELPRGGKTVIAQQYQQRDYSQEQENPPDWMLERWEQMQKGGTA